MDERFKTPEWPKKVIEKQKDFWDLMYDAKNQFSQLQFAVYSKRLSEEEIVKQNKEFRYLYFLDYISTHNESISEKIINNEGVQHMIIIYNELIDRAKQANSKKEMEEINVDKEEFIQKYNLGFD